MAQFKLCIQDDNESNLFYNAVGGKSAGRMVKVVLVETLTQRIVTNQVVKLAVSLTYESGQFVSNPEICRTLKNSCLTIDRDTPAVINFRIDEVSSHHQGQLFRLLVSPVVEDEYHSTSTIHSIHIDSVFSDPVEVRSKVVFTKKEKKTASSNSCASEDDFDGDDVSLSTTTATVKSVNKSQQRKSNSTGSLSKKVKIAHAAVTNGSTVVSTSIASTHKISFDNSNVSSSTATTSTTAAPVVTVATNRLHQIQHNFASVSCDDLDHLESSLLYLLPLAHTIKNTLSTSTNIRHQQSQQQSSTVQCEVLTSVVQTAVILAEQMETLTAIVQQTKFQQQQQFQQMQQQVLVTSAAVMESTENSCNSITWEELFSRQSSNVINDSNNNDSSNDIIIITDEIFNSNTAFITTTTAPSSTITPFAALGNTTTAGNTTANMNDMIVKPMLCRGYSSSWDSEFPSSNTYYDDNCNNNSNYLFRGMNNSNIIADNDDSDVEGSGSNNGNLYSAVVGQKRKYTSMNNFDSTASNNDAFVPMPRLSRQSSFTTIIIESILGLDYTTTNS